MGQVQPTKSVLCASLAGMSISVHDQVYSRKEEGVRVFWGVARALQVIIRSFLLRVQRLWPPNAAHSSCFSGTFCNGGLDCMQ